MKAIVEIIEKTSQQNLSGVTLNENEHKSFGYNETVQELLRKHALSAGDADCEDAFFVADLGSIVRQHSQWKSLLPRVEPFYAIKCNPDPVVVATLHYLGANFDCASKAEIELALSVGANPSNLIYANPCKGISHIEYATSNGVKLMTFDNSEELIKIKRVAPHSELLLRILTDDSKAVCQLGKKFGASLTAVPNLLKLAQELNLKIRGISFHVGSGCMDANAFADAVILARKAFDIGASLGFNFDMLDVGGGFPGNSESKVSKGPLFPEIAKSLGPTIDRLFDKSVRVIAEPGRYYVSAAFTLAVNIVARRTISNEPQPEHDINRSYMYYVNDGVYGSFNCTVFDHNPVTPKTLVKSGSFFYQSENSTCNETFKSSLWGPTCDSIDCIGTDYYLPQHDIGDWFYFDNMGAYTLCAASQFNGFKKSKIHYTSGELS